MFHSFDLTPAHIHDVNHLKDVKHNLKRHRLKFKRIKNNQLWDQN